MNKRIMMITTSPLPYGNNITDGPGYRAWHLFSHVARKHEVTALSLYESFHLGLNKESEVYENNIRVKCISHKPKRIANLIKQEKPDVLYLPWSSTPFLSRLKRKIPTILDYVGAGLLEEYVAKGHVPATFLQMKLKSFWLGDFFMTAGRRERYYLLGLLAASGKLSQGKTDQADPLIYVVPMTPPPEPPVLKENVIQKKPGELVLLIAGAFLPWYDYATFFEALKVLHGKGVGNLKVVFMGGNTRNKGYERAVRNLADKPEIRENVIFTGLVPFKRRANYYLLADAAASIPPNTIEDELSVRTRVVDYVWAGLPLVSPGRDEYSATVLDEGGGFSYEAGKPESLAKTLTMLIVNPEKLEGARGKMEGLLKTKFNIENFISPLEAFIKNPSINPARLSPTGISSDVFLWIRDMLNLLNH
jgi:glycosyltransferase involved in cell wall biosynthesis